MIASEKFIADDGTEVSFVYTDDQPGVLVTVLSSDRDRGIDFTLTVPAFKALCKTAVRLDERIS